MFVLLVIYVDLFICLVGVMIIDEVMNFWNFYEVFWIIVEGVFVKYFVEEILRDRSYDFWDLFLCVGVV